MQTGAEQLRDWMARREFNQAAAADYLGITEAFVSLLINGKRLPGRTNAVAIARKTGIPVEAWSDEMDKSVETASVNARKRAS